ncbi:MAG: hypothetical protein H7829_19285 [Magnetococcus sp. THC-1_WYH]
MTTMISEVYEAFRAAGVPDDKARQAAEVLAQEQLATKSDIARIEKELAVIKWMLALVVAAEVLPIIKTLFAQG